jgi:hypothetical protein
MAAKRECVSLPTEIFNGGARILRGMVGNVIWERLTSHAISHGRREVDSISSWARSMDFEKELLDAFDRIVYEDFPNSQRVACPGREVLLKLTQRPGDKQLANLLAHVRHVLRVSMN